MAARGSGDLIAGVKLSHPDKVLFDEQGITKRDLAMYFQQVAPLMLPQIEGRLVSLVRCPDGSDGACFFQRHVSPGMPASFEKVQIAGSEGKRETYMLLAGEAGLVAAAQFGVLEIHIWGATADDIERPNRLVFDLDPGEGVDFAAVKSAAVDLRDSLAGLGLDSVPLLTGGKGIHVIVPIARRHPWPVVKAFCRAVAERLADSEPDRFIATMAKARRKGRIFIDYLRNDRSATAIAPFSPRARAGAPVAWPLEWTGLGKATAANMVTLADVLAGKRKPALWKRYPARQALKLQTLRAAGVEAA
jgi:bifunctional non-homologous end joining protein LigD